MPKYNYINLVINLKFYLKIITFIKEHTWLANSLSPSIFLGPKVPVYPVLEQNKPAHSKKIFKKFRREL